MGRRGESGGREVLQEEGGEDDDGGEVGVDVFAYAGEVGESSERSDGVEGAVVSEQVDLLELGGIQLMENQTKVRGRIRGREEEGERKEE